MVILRFQRKKTPTQTWVALCRKYLMKTGVSAEMNCTHTGTKETVMCPSSTGTGGTSGEATQLLRFAERVVGGFTGICKAEISVCN